MVILKFFKNFIIHISIIILFLIINALSSLSLPTYMSHIVNVGIQQKGMQYKIPQVLEEKEFNKFISLTENSDILKNNYNFIKACDSNYKKIYPVVNYSNIYVLKKINKNTENILFNIFLKIMPKIYNNEDDYKNYSSQQLQKMLKTYIENKYNSININYIKIQKNFMANISGKMLLISLIGMVSSIIVSLYASIVSSSLAKELRKAIFNKVMSFSNKELDKFSVSSLITISTNDINQIQYFTLLFLRMILFAIVLGLGGIFKVIFSDVSIKYIIIFSVLSLLIIVITLFAFIVPKFSFLQKLQDKLNLITRESLTGIFVIRAFSNQKKEEEKFDKVNLDISKINLFINRTMGLMHPFIILVFNYTTIAIIWLGSKYVNNGTMQVGSIMAFIEYCATIIMSFLMLSMVSIILPRAIVSIKRISNILNTKSSIKDNKNSILLEEKVKELEFENVSFKYEDSEEYAIKNISFKAKNGETIAFIGSTGSGKTTIFNLLLRFYNINEGSIKINEIDIKKIKLNSLRKKLGYVPQKALLFSGNIESNLKIGAKNNITEEYMKKFLNISQMADFINKKTEGLKYNISQGGLNLSGGQRQRLSIARALIKDCDIYILDDSFSALDYKTDKILRNEIKENFKDKIFLIISQRISTIKNADTIIVLDNGEIVGKGKHEDLIKNCEVYKQIAKSQLP